MLDKIDLNNSRTLTILVIVVLILFAIVYICVNWDGFGKENFTNYPVAVDDLVQLQGGLKNVQVGSEPLEKSINRLIQQSLNNVVPPLSIVSFYGSSSNAPEGWQFCDGTPLTDINGKAVRITGTTNPFKTPNMQGRVIVGVNSGTAASGGASLDINGVNISTYKFAQTGGEEKHKLIETEMPSHTHDYNYPEWSSEYSAASGTGKFPWKLNTFTSKPKGGDQPHNIMQPYYVLAYIIKQPAANQDNSFVSLPNPS